MDLERFRDGSLPLATFLPVSWTAWKRGDFDNPLYRVRVYRSLLAAEDARNIREAVKIVTVATQAWTLRRNEERKRSLLARARARKKPGYLRALPRKKAMILASEPVCAYCGLWEPKTVDHIVPVSRGGDHRRRNLAPACWPCNQEKGQRTPEEWREARRQAGLQWPPEHRDQSFRTFPGTLPTPPPETTA